MGDPAKRQCRVCHNGTLFAIIHVMRIETLLSSNKDLAAFILSMKARIPFLIRQCALSLMLLITSLTAAPVQAKTPLATTNAAPVPTLQPDTAALNQPARFDRIAPADGLSHPVIRDILQDRRGFMWFATDSGLNKYDGYEFTVYKNIPGDPTSIRFDAVWVVHEDREGTLWVGGGGGLDRFDRTTETFVHVDT